MKHLIFTFLILSVCSLACQKKSTPVITERKTEPPSRVENLYAAPGTVIPDTVEGKKIFTNRCGRCHGLPDPVQFTASRWENILASMLPRIRVSQEQAVHVRAYVLANVAK